FALIVLSSLIGILSQGRLPDLVRKLFSSIGFYWIAAVVYFLLFIVAIDLIRLVAGRTRLFKALVENGAFLSAIGLVIIFLVIGLLVYGTCHARNIRITSYPIHIEKSAGSLKKLHIVMISDLHLTDISDWRRHQIIKKVNELHPDIVVIPGDIVPIENPQVADDFHKIRSHYGVFASLGNHDYYQQDVNKLILWLQQAGVQVLREQSVKVADSFYLVGRDDKSYEMISGKKRKKIADLTADIDRKLPVILLDHQPVDLEAARDAGVDLQLSGHTHKGQFFPFGLITRKVFRIDYGYLRIGTLQVIVSSGAGTWGPPIRIGSLAEVVDIQATFQ
ncbi:MAG TPA: metallophosphoesterase, partial [Firmicutes bacterium]|nr:metallophosphoesterase [Bacillota bacterium]